MLTKERQKLVEDNMNLAQGIGAKTHRKYRNIMTFDEIRAEAVYGLVLSAKSYDFDSDVPFRGYATFRIRGQILDGLRMKKWSARRSEENFVFIESISKNNDDMKYEFEDSYSPCSWDLDRVNFFIIISELLSDNECKVFYEYFYKNKKLKKIGEEKGVSESAVSKSVVNIKKKVRKYLEETKDQKGSLSYELELIKY